MEKNIVYGLIVFSFEGPILNEDYIIKYPENLTVNKNYKKKEKKIFIT